MRHTRTPLALAAALALSLSLAPAAPAQAGWFGPAVDPELVAQVPFNKRSSIDAADYTLAAANEDLKVAQMSEDLADLRQDYAELATKLAKAQVASAQLALDIARLEAVQAQGLGKRADNAKLLLDLKADAVKNETERIDLKAKLSTTDVMVRDTQQRLTALEKDVEGFKARRGAPAGSAGDPASAARATPPTASKPAPQAPQQAAPVTQAADPNAVPQAGGEVISETPSPEAAPAVPATPEGDLKN